MMILMPLFGQEPAQEPAQADCEFFGAKHDRFVSRIMGRKGISPHQQQVSEMTNAVAAVLPKVVAGSRTATGQKESTIDYYLFGAMQNAGVTPALHFYYWGDDISPSCVENGCWSTLHNAQKTRAGALNPSH